MRDGEETPETPDLNTLPTWARDHIDRLSNLADGATFNPWQQVGTVRPDAFESLPEWAQEQIVELEEKIAERREAWESARIVLRRILVLAGIGLFVVVAMESDS